MKNWKILLAVLLVVVAIGILVICATQETPADKTATVTFYNGGEVYETVTVEIGAKLTLPETPKGEKGKGLAGWSTIDGDVEEIIDPATYVVNADISLYAVWADVFTVTINADNGTPFEVKEVLAGTILEKPADPVKEGFRFVEWRDALQDTTFDFSQPIYADVILKAMYGDGAPNRVSDTKWDFSSGIHGAWIGAQGGWKYEVNGLPAADMVYQTTEDGYAAWGFTLTDNLDNIPEVNGKNAAGLGMKYIYNEGIAVEASKAKLVVIYLKPKYFPIDMSTSPEDQFRISVLTSNGGMIYGYGNGSEAWSLRTDGAGANHIQVDQMEDGWIRVQFKIHKLEVWSEDAIVKSMAISFVQRKSEPVMDIISVKSIELLDQEEFVDPHKADYSTKSEWDMTNAKDAADWSGYHAKKKNEALSTKVTGNGMSVTYHSPGNGWKGIILEDTLLDISKLSGKLTFTYSSNMPITSYRIHILTDLGGSLTTNGTEDCYVAANISDIDAGKLPAWTRTANADGSITVTFDLNSLAYFANGEELMGLTIVTVTSNKVTGTVTYKSIEMEKNLDGHDCQVEGHFMKEASCVAPMTCYVCGATEGKVEDHIWEAATCQAPKTCSVCRTTEGTVTSHRWSAATCQTPKTCYVCGKKEGAVADHSFAEGFCSVCGIPEVIRTEWNMSNKKDAADWTGYHAKKKNEALTTTVTNAGTAVEYQSPGNGWKGIILEKTLIETDKLTGKLSFTYSSDMAITSYRIHILTDLGGKLTANGTADCYIAAKIADITAGNLEAWTQTTNADGSITVTFDLTSMGYFARGKELKGLTIVTVTANNTTGTVTYKTIELELDLEGYDCQADGHIMKDATCTDPKTCRACGATEGEATGHTWMDATCTAPKTCSVCGTTEGEPSDHVDANGDYKCDHCEVEYCANHTWSDATCTAPKTCTVCGATEGEKLAHTDTNKDCVCDVCASNMVVWYMNNAADAADWAGYHAKKKNEALTTAVTEAGLGVTYEAPGNGWKGIALEGTAIDISELTGKLRFTYSSDMAITSYRIHILTDLGGNLTANGTADCYTAVSVANITAGNLEAWTQTTNPDGSVTVTFDLATMGYFANGTELKGLTIVTVTANNTTGTVTYKTIELEKLFEKYDCQVGGHIWNEASCAAPKTCSVCGTTEGEALGHDWVDADCDTPKTCNTCGETEGEAVGHTWNDATCTAPKTCAVCGATEGEPGNHADANGDYKCDNCDANLCTDHTWNDATCTAPKTCSICGATEGEVAGHTWSDATCTAPKTCTVCGATEGEAAGHTWKDATCTAPKTCSVCGATEGERIAHTDADKDLACDICADNMIHWNMSNAADAADWSGYHAKKKNEALSTTVTEAGLGVTYETPGNGWKGIVLEGAAIDISKLSGKLTFTYSSDMAITNYRIHILTDLGGNLTANGTADCYTAASIANITAGNLEAWTQTTNADGSITVTFDLTTMGYFANGAELRGLTIVTVTANNTTGTVTYKTIELEKKPEKDSCQLNGHTWNDATCTAPKSCTVCGATDGEAAGHTWKVATCQTPKTCSVCGTTEGEVADHTFAEGVCNVCGTAESVPATPNVWDMSKEADAAAWAAYHAKKKNESLTTTVTEAGLDVAYGGSGNGWKGIILEDVALDISKLTGKFAFTYSSDMAITSYRIHILTDLGGNPTGGSDANFYATASIADITAGNQAAWTQTTNADGSITVTFDLATMGYFANGTELKSLTIVTVTANKVTGTVTYKSIELENKSEEQGCDHTWNDATCTAPKTCATCGATEGEAVGHTWNDATCTVPKTCSVCGETEGEPTGHTWNDATCTAPKTCTVCGATEGEPAGHSFAQGVCTVCGAVKPVQNQWVMSNEADAADWAGYHSKLKNEALTTTVTEAGLGITYEAPGNGWKGIVLEKTALDISKLSGKLTFTYSSDMAITNYRIHILTDLGGNLTANGTADNYVAVSIANITAGKLEAWTQTTNPDGSVTVTFDLSTLGHFANGTELKGLTIVTVTANGVTGTVTYKSIELEESICWVNGHTWSDATCQAPKTCTVCGATVGDPADHTFAEGVCTVCGAAENIPATPIVWDMSNAAAASQWYSAQAYTSVKPEVTTAEVTADGFKVNYLHKNGWKGIVLKNVEIDITGLSGLLSFTYIEEMDITNYRIHILTDKGGDLGSNTSGTPSDYYAAVSLSDIAQSSVWNRTVNADGSITVTFDLTTLPFFKEGTVLKGMDIVTVTATGTTGTVTYKSIGIR